MIFATSASFVRPTWSSPYGPECGVAEPSIPCAQHASQPSTSMARTAIRAERSDVLHDSPRLTFDSGGYSYEIASGVDRQPIYTVVNGTQSSFWDISLAGEKGIPALRSQPYRLQSSRCWSARDVRLTCVACHDPHRPLVTDGRAYDERCLTCHVTSGVEPTSERMGRQYDALYRQLVSGAPVTVRAGAASCA